MKTCKSQTQVMMQKSLVWLISWTIAIASLGCGLNRAESSGLVKGKQTMVQLPMVVVKADIEENAVEQVRLVGRYVQIDVRQRPDSPPVYNGNVALVLEDGTEVLLYPVWHVEAKRPKEEISRFEQKQVTVVGTIFPKAPSNPSHAANFLMPCLTEVQSIELAN
ncbi:hypothetical protein [Cylindrospermum stagnale]